MHGSVHRNVERAPAVASGGSVGLGPNKRGDGDHMKPIANVRNTHTTFTALALGLALLGAAGCAEPAGDVETTQSAITGGWTNLVLINGWQNFNTSTYPPAVGIVNGVVTFRGAIKATNPTSDIAFRLDAAQFANFKPQPLNRLFMRALSRTTGGTDVGT